MLVLCLGLLLPSTTAAAATIQGHCKPQGVLLLDKPYQPPRRVELPFCQQVSSSINPQHDGIVLSL